MAITIITATAVKNPLFFTFGGFGFVEFSTEVVRSARFVSAEEELVTLISK